MADLSHYGGIDHVQLAMPARGEDEARRFYGGLLGLIEVDKPPRLAVRGGCWFVDRAGAVHVHLGVDPDFRPATKAHPAFVVHDLDLLCRRLEAAGGEVVQDGAIADVRRFHTTDPFGNRLEFIAEPDRGFTAAGKTAREHDDGPPAASDRPQNTYDDPEFFAGYSGLARAQQEWGTAFEHDDFTRLLPEVAGSRVLDLGCGAGQLSLYLAQAGAAEVTGIDVSERMLERARAERPHARVRYVREAIETLDYSIGSFDLIVSSLAIHYVADYADLMRRVARWLSAGGTVVYSTEHPVFLARSGEDGWVRDPDGQPVAWAINRYGEEGARDEHWFREGVRKYFRRLDTLLNGLIEARLTIDRVVEPMPTAEQLREHPEWSAETVRPMFLLVRATKARMSTSRGGQPGRRP